MSDTQVGPIDVGKRYTSNLTLFTHVGPLVVVGVSSIKIVGFHKGHEETLVRRFRIRW